MTKLQRNIFDYAVSLEKEANGLDADARSYLSSMNESVCNVKMAAVYRGIATRLRVEVKVDQVRRAKAKAIHRLTKSV